MLPKLSWISVSIKPDYCLRFWYSFKNLQILFLHLKFYNPLFYSSNLLLKIDLVITTKILLFNYDYSLLTLYTQLFRITLALFVSPRLLARNLPGLFFQVKSKSFLVKELYNQMAVIIHSISLNQACAHCSRFPTAAIRKCLDLVSVLVWLYILSDQLRIIGLVSSYLTNYLILHRLIS